MSGAKDDAPRPFLIGAHWIDDSESVLVSINPADGQTNWRTRAALPQHVDQAVAVATSAAADPAWRSMLPQQRARLLARIGDVIDARAEQFARAQMLENGKLLTECRMQARSAAATFRYFAAVLETLGSDQPPARGNYWNMVVHEPYGVVAAITPWNSPLTMEAQKVAPALAAGNAVLLKPSELTCAPALALGAAALEAGLPAGLLNVLPGSGAHIGDALVRHPGVRMVSFTGGTASGRRIAAVAAERLMPVVLELGGKSPHIVFADADLARAAAAVADGIFEAGGQSCVAGSRLLVQRSVCDELLTLLLKQAGRLTLGMPDLAQTTMGPLASYAQRDRVERYVASARAQGGTILTGGTRPQAEELSRGAFYPATIIGDLDCDATVCREEIFGPVLCVLPFDDEADLLRQANGTVYGLAAGIWTADYRRAWRIARQLDAGTVWINTYKQLSIGVPFGGFKESGLGREKGWAGLRLYQQSKSLYWGLD